MLDLLGVANDGQHREGSFNRQAVMPGVCLADFEVIGQATRPAEAVVGEHDFVPIAQVVQKRVIDHVHCVPNPSADLSKGVEYPSQLNADTPATTRRGSWSPAVAWSGLDGSAISAQWRNYPPHSAGWAGPSTHPCVW